MRRNGGTSSSCIRSRNTWYPELDACSTVPPLLKAGGLLIVATGSARDRAVDDGPRALELRPKERFEPRGVRLGAHLFLRYCACANRWARPLRPKRDHGQARGRRIRRRCRALKHRHMQANTFLAPLARARPRGPRPAMGKPNLTACDNRAYAYVEFSACPVGLSHLPFVSLSLAPRRNPAATALRDAARRVSSEFALGASRAAGRLRTDRPKSHRLRPLFRRGSLPRATKGLCAGLAEPVARSDAGGRDACRLPVERQSPRRISSRHRAPPKEKPKHLLPPPPAAPLS